MSIDIPYGRQDVTPEDIAAVAEVLRSDWLTQGPAVPRFEQAIQAYCGAAHAVAVNSATSALHIACAALGVGPGDLVWTSAITFVASANCALYCGAAVDFVDIDAKTCNISVSELRAKLERARRQGRLPKVVIPVHLMGESCNMREIRELGREFGFAIIEDASHAIGGRYDGEPIGSCRYSDITVFSFHPVKIITSAEGGMAVTNHPQLAARLRQLRTHGIVREAAELTREADGPWYYEQVALGFNYRMTDVQAALGASQAKRLDAYVRRRHEIAAVYDRAFRDLPVLTPCRSADSLSALHLYVVRLQLEQLEVSRKSVFLALREAGIGVNVHYMPVPMQPYYQRMGFNVRDFPNAERYYQQAISLPLFPNLSEAQQQRVIEVLTAALKSPIRA